MDDGSTNTVLYMAKPAPRNDYLLVPEPMFLGYAVPQEYVDFMKAVFASAGFTILMFVLLVLSALIRFLIEYCEYLYLSYKYGF